MLNLILLSSLSFLACTAGKDSGADDSSITDSEVTTDDSDTTIPEFALGGTWTDDCTYNLIIENPAAGSLFGLGMAETGAGTNGWYGEDGMTADTTHPVGATGVTLASVHADCGGGGIDDIKFGESTLFTMAFDPNITYFVGEVDAGGAPLSCFAWGNDVSYSYYEGCTDIN